MYKSPIEMLVADIQHQIVQQQDEEIYKAVVSVGINVVKNELIRALQYDRQQYDKGYADGKADAQKWIPVTERLPESQKMVLVSAKSKTLGYRHTLMVAHIGHHEATTEDYGWREYEGDTEYDEEKDCFWIPECWWEVNSVEDNGNWIIDSDYEVTHWMPLPQLPTTCYMTSEQQTRGE